MIPFAQSGAAAAGSARSRASGWLTQSERGPYYSVATDRAPFFGVRWLNADQPPFFFRRDPQPCISST